MKCPLCKGRMAKGKKTNLPYEFDGEKIIVVRNVPASVCGQCGEAFVEIAILRRVEKILTKAARNGLVMGFVEYKKAA
jgi:YgiT-type zinc finger domain-containing protein